MLSKTVEVWSDEDWQRIINNPSSYDGDTIVVLGEVHTIEQPEDTHLNAVLNISGDAKVRKVYGVDIQSIDGNARVDTILGDCCIKDIEGDAVVGEIAYDCEVKNISENATVGMLTNFRGHVGCIEGQAKIGQASNVCIADMYDHASIHSAHNSRVLSVADEAKINHVLGKSSITYYGGYAPDTSGSSSVAYLSDGITWDRGNNNAVIIPVRKLQQSDIFDALDCLGYVVSDNKVTCYIVADQDSMMLTYRGEKAEVHIGEPIAPYYGDAIKAKTTPRGILSLQIPHLAKYPDGRLKPVRFFECEANIEDCYINYLALSAHLLANKVKVVHEVDENTLPVVNR
jgi:hypothetical protein